MDLVHSGTYTSTPWQIIMLCEFIYKLLKYTCRLDHQPYAQGHLRALRLFDINTGLFTSPTQTLPKGHWDVNLILSTGLF